MRASEVTKRPVVTLDGDDIAQIKDVVYGDAGGAVTGFTLAGRGLFAGPSKQALAWPAVLALGADAVMVRENSSLASIEEVLEAARSSGGSGGDVLGSQVLTDTGKDLGKVTDVVIEISDVAGSGRCDVVGYEIEASEAFKSAGTTLLIPLPDTMAASGDHLIVPAAATDFVRDDLAGFGAAVNDFRAELERNA